MPSRCTQNSDEMWRVRSNFSLPLPPASSSKQVSSSVPYNRQRVGTRAEKNFRRFDSVQHAAAVLANIPLAELCARPTVAVAFDLDVVTVGWDGKRQDHEESDKKSSIHHDVLLNV
jgi:hypothetical protein